ncbi:TPA: hypothetical protein ACHTYT_004110 [Klebsiella pneumoniae]|uniref:hypothetical protein n=1 Tax=Klebsiella pneumoniae TaxID=573 RepID=UPI002658A9F7|nr:hypothetical protein [Klebsiella pneumoniae]
MTTSDIIAFSGVVVSGVSAIASVITLLFARTALNTWKSQEVLKAKKDFKMALLELKFIVLWLPEDINVDHLMIGRNLIYDSSGELKSKFVEKQIKAFENYAREFEKFEDAMQVSARLWFACEGLFKSTDVEGLWKGVYLAYNEYTQGRKNQSYFISKLDELLIVEMYFDNPS